MPEGCGIALSISIYQTNLAALLRKGGRKLNGSGSLAHTTLVVVDSDHHALGFVQGRVVLDRIDFFQKWLRGTMLLRSLVFAVCTIVDPLLFYCALNFTISSAVVVATLSKLLQERRKTLACDDSVVLQFLEVRKYCFIHEYLSCRVQFSHLAVLQCCVPILEAAVLEISVLKIFQVLLINFSGDVFFLIIKTVHDIYVKDLVQRDTQFLAYHCTFLQSAAKRNDHRIAVMFEHVTNIFRDHLVLRDQTHGCNENSMLLQHLPGLPLKTICFLLASRVWMLLHSLRIVSTDEEGQQPWHGLIGSYFLTLPGAIIQKLAPPVIPLPQDTLVLQHSAHGRCRVKVSVNRRQNCVAAQCEGHVELAMVRAEINEDVVERRFETFQKFVHGQKHAVGGCHVPAHSRFERAQVGAPGQQEQSVFF